MLPKLRVQIVEQKERLLFLVNLPWPNQLATTHLPTWFDQTQNLNTQIQNPNIQIQNPNMSSRDPSLTRTLFLVGWWCLKLMMMTMTRLVVSLVQNLLKISDCTHHVNIN